VIGDRRAAIERALAVAARGDGWAVLIAGKGHEDTQVVGTVATPFSDRQVAVQILEQIQRKVVDHKAER
jgi:UDP-N-acetylmuramoyl-L-alanyl-D-glutamate--2,6-diaminopimelate ligase